MILVIDIGNSTVSSAAYRGEEIFDRFTMPSKGELFLTQDWQYNYTAWTKQYHFSHVFFSSVVPSLTQTFLDFLATFVPHILCIQKKYYSVLPVRLVNPDQIGTDLIANASSAWTQVCQACLVIDFGTALTFTSVDDQGLLCGVSIAPGLYVALSALLNNTEQLEQISMDIPDTALGKDTVHATQAGTVLGYSFLVKGLIQQIKSELGSHTKVFITGGLSSVFLDVLKSCVDYADVNLTLKGIYIIGQRILQQTL